MISYVIQLYTVLLNSTLDKLYNNIVIININDSILSNLVQQYFRLYIIIYICVPVPVRVWGCVCVYFFIRKVKKLLLTIKCITQHYLAILQFTVIFLSLCYFIIGGIHYGNKRLCPQSVIPYSLQNVRLIVSRERYCTTCHNNISKQAIYAE